ncbi:DNA-binding protein WhiA [Effusibacillus dendaii]|uniref:Probable cell division protein WhiA n=1 Tax=Effusibacillus dendaii TaxID=2743772 RepID=A0A7I8DD50_9BACL|nr:DNA-binding protein WhiA [Effusibacillus dendaii]BCJ87947.1 putative sporulation transcription regulator WhiA [Effusibacillus dendaii]
MSFASRTKKELTQLETKVCCQKAELSAMVRLNGQLSEGRRPVLDISTENAAIARRIYTLMRKMFDVHAEVLVRKKMRLKKNNIYMVRVPFRVQEILSELKIAENGVKYKQGIDQELFAKSCCKRSYLRGAFLAAGSVNDPESNSYHLEIALNSSMYAHSLLELVNEFDLHAKLIERKRVHVVYIKEGEKIIEFLNIIGAHQALLRFEDVRILKGMRNQVNRLVNCETANLNKTIHAAVRQIENIRLVEQQIGLGNLPPHLKEVAELRLKYPDINLKELGSMLAGNVSKSGVNHRLRKLEQMAEKLREGSV